MQEVFYKRPTKKPELSKYSSGMIKFFKDRGISEKTLISNKVSEGNEYMPQVSGERNTIQFNYYKDGELINIKYRDGEKTLNS